MGRLEGKAALVTGAGGGIGKAVATRFAAEGARVAVVDVSGEQDDVAAAIGERAIAVEADVSREDDVERMIASAVERFGRLDILCNNAAVFPEMLPTAEVSTADFDRQIAVNLRGVFLGMKHGIRAMLAHGEGGSIVNIGAIVAFVVQPGIGVYAAAKAGVVQLTKTAALEYAAQGIRVNAVCPGSIGTEHMLASVPDEIVAQIPRLVPMQRLGTPDELAAAVLFFASDESSYVTGVAIPVDGGYVLP